MTDGLKPYRLNGLPFIHDNRGKFIRDGGMAWLSESRAEKVLRTLKSEGKESWLVATEHNSVLEVSPTESNDTACEHSEGEAPEKGVNAEAVLAMHFKKRKQIARELSGLEEVTTKQADEIIKSTDDKILEQFIQVD